MLSHFIVCQKTKTDNYQLQSLARQQHTFHINYKLVKESREQNTTLIFIGIDFVKQFAQHSKKSILIMNSID